MRKEEFKIKKEHLGDFKHNSEEHGFNNIVISGSCQGDIKDYQRVGRIIQVRKNKGLFETDIILIRIMDGDIMSFTNQSFFSVSDDFKKFYDDMFPEELDEPNREYSIMGEDKEKGFIIK